MCTLHGVSPEGHEITVTAPTLAEALAAFFAAERIETHARSTDPWVEGWVAGAGQLHGLMLPATPPV